MKYLLLFILVIVFSISWLFAQQGGNLVIVGGALDSNNEAVYQTFIYLAGDNKDAIISIVPAASGSPSSSAESFKNNLIHYGVHPENIYIIPIAMFDCQSTPDVDESLWKDGAENPDVAEIIEKSTGIWFTGGDQSRIVSTLLREDGRQTPALEALWQTFLNGAVIGGTSAGAAMMSPVMITGGVSMAALKHGVSDKYIDMEQQDNGPLTLGHGLGFFKNGIIDQHFDKKNRLGRLIVAVYFNRNQFPLGFGIDENTALVYYSKTGLIEVVGEGGVTIVDGRNAQRIKKQRKTFIYLNFQISYLEQGDAFNLSIDQYDINPEKKLTTGNEFYSISTEVQSGIFSSFSTTYKDLISYHLIDNKACKKVVTYCFDNSDTAFKVTFSKIPETEGYWTNNLKGRDSYSFIRVKVDVEPVRIILKGIK